MGNKEKNYLHLLAGTKKVLYITQKENQIVSNVSKVFLESFQITANEEMLDNLTVLLTQYDVSLVIIDAQQVGSLCKFFYDKIQQFDERILVMLMIDPKDYIDIIEQFPKVDMIVENNVDEALLEKKLFILLSLIYTKNCLMNENKAFRDKNLEKESITEFLDNYEGSSLFITDELLDILKELDSGVLSHSTLIKIANEVEEVSKIFNALEVTKGVAPIYKDLAIFLRELDLNSIKPKNINAFDYLSNILSDISVYLTDIFVERLFSDVTIFQYSLQSNIEFMKNALHGIEKDTSELSFFND